MAAGTGGRGAIEVRTFKWPHRATNATRACLLGEDAHGRWLGVRTGDPWWALDDSRSGTFIGPVVKVVPIGSYWSACFYPGDPAVDVDIVLPARWDGAILAETDLELDVLRAADGRVWVRDEDAFADIRTHQALPDTIVARALTACADVRARLAVHAEPFGAVGPAWLARFLADGAAAGGEGRGDA